MSMHVLPTVPSPTTTALRCSMMIEGRRGKGQRSGSGGGWVGGCALRVGLVAVVAVGASVAPVRVARAMLLWPLAGRVFESVRECAGGAGWGCDDAGCGLSGRPLTAPSQRSRPLLTGRLFRAACWSVPTTRLKEKHRAQPNTSYQYDWHLVIKHDRAQCSDYHFERQQQFLKRKTVARRDLLVPIH